MVISAGDICQSICLELNDWDFKIERVYLQSLI